MFEQEGQAARGRVRRDAVLQAWLGLGAVVLLLESRELGAWGNEGALKRQLRSTAQVRL